MHNAVRDDDVTVRVTTLKGSDAGAYYVEVLPRYYLDGDEPPGRWLGTATESLGVGGQVTEVEFLAVMAGCHPASGDQLGRRYGEESVRGFDVTASAPKSVSVLFALGDDHVRAQVLDAHDAAAAAMVGWIEGHAHTRRRLEGRVVVIDAEGIVAAAFRQHTSRSLDPQLHTHVVIPNRVRGPDGRWLALDARTIKCDQRTLSALYHAGLRAELTRRLGVRWQQPVNGIAEIDGVPSEVLEEFSSRARAVAERVQDKLERFYESFGRDPTPRERWRLEREAVIDSRPAKADGTDAESLHQEWTERAEALGHEPEAVVTAALGLPPRQAQLDLFAEELVAVAALDALVEKQSSWRAAEVCRELAAALPTDTALTAAEVVARVDAWADAVIARHLVELSGPPDSDAPLRRDGRPVTEAATARALTTPDVLAQEEAILAWAERRLGAGSRPVPIRKAEDLDLAQAELAAAVAGNTALVLAVGPAGSGKTTALAPGVAELGAQGREVFGVAPSAGAAAVLGEAGLAADTLDKLLVEHRLGQPQPPYDLPADATVIVDEAAMVPTPRLAELAALADARGWRVVLVGDPLQFSAVGRGGMFAHLVECCGAIELDRVRRFSHPWERAASLGLRQGDAGVLDLYEAQGRLRGGSARQMQAEVVRAWWHSTRVGESALMTAPTNQAVAELNRRAQRLRAGAGEIDTDRQILVSGGQAVCVGDRVVTRRNHRQLRTDTGAMVRNRDVWEVAGLEAGGGVRLVGGSGEVRLPAAYARAHLELAYAQTAHAAQGRTVDRSFLFLDGPCDTRGIYVPLSRGRLSNHAFVVTEAHQRAADVLAEALNRNWIDRPALARRAELVLGRPFRGPRASGLLDPVGLRQLIELDHAWGRALERARWEHRAAADRLRAATERQERLGRSLAEDHRRLEHARERIWRLDRPLLRHRHEIERWRGVMVSAQRSIEATVAVLAALEEEIPALERAGTDAQKRHDQLVNDQRRLEDRFALAADLGLRASGMALDPPGHALELLGPRPSDTRGARRWDQTAARIEQHRVAFGITDDELLGPAPRWDDLGAYASSHRKVAEACQQRTRELGREHIVEPPAPHQGLSL